MPNLKALAERLPDQAYSFLERPPRYAIKTVPAPASPSGSRSGSSASGEFETIHLLEERSPSSTIARSPASKTYRVVVLRKRLAIEKGQLRLFEEYRYFFYITNDRDDAGRRRSSSRPTTAATRRT